jgi:hypothetical protein
VPQRLRHLPADATHLVISAGGNNALGYGGVLSDPACTVGDAVMMLAEIGDKFREAYYEMLKSVLSLRKPTAVCTVYDSVPELGVAEKTALGLFNDVILRAAFTDGLPVIDLRLLCISPHDYSSVSPIEPSHLGGAKIARLIAEVVTTHDFECGRSVVYW